jgi:hypothetical protein
MAPTLIEGPYGANVYPKLVAMVRNSGAYRSSRNGDSIDLGHVITHLYSPLGALPLGTGRNLSRKIAAAEACQLIGAFSDVELMIKASPNFARFMEPGLGNFHGAYGVRIGHQLPAVINKLQAHRDTRQAVITLWDTLLDNQVAKRDYPCTVALHFEIVADRLNMNTIMRSNDVWLGVPYDWFQFTQLQLTMCNVLGVEPGTYTHQSLSTHIYTKDLEASDALHMVNPDQFAEAYDIMGFGEPGEDAIFKVMQRAKQVTRVDLPDSTNSEGWFRQQFRPTPHPSQLGGNVASRGEGPEQPEPVQS